MHYLRAFWQALILTLRGEQPPAPLYAAQRAWVAQLAGLVDAVYAAAETEGLDAAARRALILRIEGRDMSMETILATLKYHAEQEYPYLFQHITTDLYTALYASNFNDAFWVIRLESVAALQTPPMQAALKALSAHLEALPAVEGN